MSDQRDEFFAEVQELFEGLSRDLFGLDEAVRKGESDAELINDIFRAVHTLKGLAGMFGASRMSVLSHELEDLLDDLRLGRRVLNKDTLDLLFHALEVYGRLLQLERQGDKSPAPEADALVAEVAQLVQKQAAPSGPPRELYDFDPGLLSVLTEYEEHRLRTNVLNGFTLFRIRATFHLSTIDHDLDALKARAKPHGEIITYLPTGEGGDAERIDLEILLASRTPLARLREVIAGDGLVLEEVERTPGAGHERRASGTPRLGDGASSSPAPAAGSGAPGDTSGAPAGAPTTDTRELRAAKDGAGGGLQTSLRSVSQSVRVDIRKLDNLMNVVGELAIVRSSLGRITERVRSNPGMRELGFELHRLQRGFERHLAAMQDGILEVRMVPIGQIFDKLGRVVRQVSREAGKQINLVITGADTEVDKLIVEELSDPLVHMIRNSIDHGIEPQSDRRKVGKPEAGTIAINAFQQGSHVLIEIEDDGRGMDEARLIEVAVRRGFLAAGEGHELSQREIFGLIFLPGFSTKDQVDMMAGRGVGMDIVKTNIGRLGGVIDVQSQVGIGTKMAITLPITLAILSVLIVQVGRHVFALPLSNVQEALVFDERQVRAVDGRETMTLRGSTLPLARLDRLFSLESRPSGHRFIVVISAGQRRLGLVVDHLEGQQDIVIKALGASLAHVSGFAGAAELGDQRVGLVLDAPAIIEEVLTGAEIGKSAVGRF